MNATITLKATNKINRLRSQLDSLEAKRQDLRFTINTTPDTQSTLDRETELHTLCNQIDRLQVAYASELIAAGLD